TRTLRPAFARYAAATRPLCPPPAITTSYLVPIGFDCRTPVSVLRETIRESMETPYDRYNYPGSVYPHAHINRLASMAFLHGVDSPELKSCRVLELGCNRGLHLIGMALLYPEAQFVGVDLSES